MITPIEEYQYNEVKMKLEFKSYLETSKDHSW